MPRGMLWAAWPFRRSSAQGPSSLESGLLDADSAAQEHQRRKCQADRGWPTAFAGFLLGTCLATTVLRWPWQATPPAFRCSSSFVGASAKLVQSARDTGDRLAQLVDVPFQVDFEFDGPTVDVDLTATDQKIVGFGGAFTEASAVVFKKLRPELRKELLERYFGPSGIGYTTGRVPINSCDFSQSSYSFDDIDGDSELRHFDAGVKHDAETIIPLIKAAQRSLAEHGRGLRLLASPWSPPAWMKTNGQMVHSDAPGLRPEHRTTWAKYISKWISAYKAHGIPIWALTPQNEPEKSQLWESCIYSAQQGADFIGGHLGTTLSEDHPEVSIFAYDHDKQHAYVWANETFSHPAATRYAHGLAVHWYEGDGFDILREVHRDFPQAVLLPTEATYERKRWAPGGTLRAGEWRFGEGYAHDILGNLEAGAAGWTDWNLLLDERGGPNHVDNVCDAAMVASLSGEELYVHPQYYFIGHFSKYLPPGSVRAATTVQGSVTYRGPTRPYGTCSGEDGLQATTFLTPDGRAATIVLNCGDSEINFRLRDRKGGRALAARIPSHAVQTYTFERSGQS